jgi:hypothetical protein
MVFGAEFTETSSGGTMKRNYLAVPTLAALLLLGCGGPNRHNSGANTGSESGTVPGGTSQMDTMSMPADTGAMRTDTGMSSGMSSDTGTAHTGTAHSGTGSRDSAKANQTKSGVTNTKTGKSTLGPGVTRTRPDQNEPVTSKGDVVDSSAQPNPTSGDSSASR